jgi:transposase-like protein
MVIIMDGVHKYIVAHSYIERESYHCVYPILMDLKLKGLNPKAITLDGHRQVIRAIKDVWPNVLIQRCLFHIQNQGLMWIRAYPKTQAGKDLRVILSSITSIETSRDMANFLKTYKNWQNQYHDFVKRLDKNSVANKDLQRTTKLINNALPNMFHFVKDQSIASTTNLLENLFSQLKHQYRNHRGLTEQHKIHYLNWYCYYRNRA